MFFKNKKLELLDEKISNIEKEMKRLELLEESFSGIDEKLSNIEKEMDEKFSNIEKEMNELYEIKKLSSEYFDSLHRKESDEPYINVISSNYSKERGIEMKLDWNNAMIKYLRSNGYNGISDEEIIEKYMADIFKMSQ